MRIRDPKPSYFPIVKSVLVLLSMWALCCASPGPVNAETQVGDKPALFALAVGVGNFKHPDPERIPPLPRPVKDARDFAALLDGSSDRFSAIKVRLLLDEEATKSNITQSLKDLVKTAGPNDLVIIYLAGHGVTDPHLPELYYFVTYDARVDDLNNTALLMNDATLFKDARSERVLLLCDACHSGGFIDILDAALVARSVDRAPNPEAKAAEKFYSSFNNLRGRVAIASSKPSEPSFESKKYPNGIFTYFLMEGLKGAADRSSRDGIITVRKLYDYVYENTVRATDGKQNPQLYCARGPCEVIPAFVDKPLKIKVHFYYEDQNHKVRPLTDGGTLKSGQHVGVAFRAESDCYVQIFSWDTEGGVTRAFPNPKLTDGDGKVEPNKTYWLPYQKGSERWYILEKTDKPGTETIYFVASRAPNNEFDSLYTKLEALSDKARSGPEGKQLATKLQQHTEAMNLMKLSGDETALKVSYEGRKPAIEAVPEEMENLVVISGADARIKLQFRHEP